MEEFIKYATETVSDGMTYKYALSFITSDLHIKNVKVIPQQLERL
jgi:hypothetical protein